MWGAEVPMPMFGRCCLPVDNLRRIWYNKCVMIRTLSYSSFIIYERFATIGDYGKRQSPRAYGRGWEIMARKRKRNRRHLHLWEFLIFLGKSIDFWKAKWYNDKKIGYPCYAITMACRKKQDTVCDFPIFVLEYSCTRSRCPTQRDGVPEYINK